MFTSTLLCIKSCFPTYCCCLAAQSCLTLCNPMDCSPLDSSVHRILQARILEWVTISSSRESFLTQGSNSCLLHLLHWQAESLLVSHQGKPRNTGVGSLSLLPQIFLTSGSPAFLVDSLPAELPGKPRLCSLRLELRTFTL